MAVLCFVGFCILLKRYESCRYKDCTKFSSSRDRLAYKKKHNKIQATNMINFKKLLDEDLVNIHYENDLGLDANLM